MYKRLIVLITISIAINACHNTGKNTAGIAATMGDMVISNEEVKLKMRLEKEVYENQSIGFHDALLMLMQQKLLLQVANNAGVEVTAAELQQFAKGVDANTKALEKLQAVKKLFNSNEAYLDQYLLPKLLEERLWNYFISNAAVHAATRQSIDSAYVLAQQTQSLAQAQASFPNTYIDTVDVIGRMDDIDVESLVVQFILDSAICAVLTQVDIGHVAPMIFENETQFNLYKVMAKDTGRVKASSLVFNKMSFKDWMNEYLAAIEVKVEDKQVLEQLASNYSESILVQAAKGELNKMMNTNK